MTTTTVHIDLVCRVCKRTARYPVGTTVRGKLIGHWFVEDRDRCCRECYMPAALSRPGGQLHANPRAAEIAAERKIAPYTGKIRTTVIDHAIAQHPTPITAYEVSLAHGIGYYSVAPRCTELANAGWLQEAPDRHAVNGAGNRVTAWRLTPAAVHQLRLI